MRKSNCIYGIILLLGLIMLSCEKDENTTPEPVEVTTGFYILNGGDAGDNNSSIAYFDEKGDMLSQDIYKAANGGAGLGDSAEQMLIYGDNIYITVTASNRLVILDKNGKLQKEIQYAESEYPDLARPRRMVPYKDKIYVTYFYGHTVAELDTTTWEITRYIKVGRYPEELVIANNKLFVANSGGLDQGYDNTISVIDLVTFKEEQKIEVMMNPKSLQTDSKGNVYVISMGDYGDIKNTLQKIDANNYEVKVIGNASCMTKWNDTLYLIYAQYGEPQQVSMKYDMASEKFVSTNLIPSLPVLVYPTLFDVDPTNGNLYIGDAEWQKSGTLYGFDSEGNSLFNPVKTGAPSPVSIYFITEKQ